MAKAIINKHIDSTLEVNKRDLFLENPELAKGEILINNDKDDPSIFIVNTENEVVKISAGEVKNELKTLEESLKILQGDDTEMSARSIAEDVVANAGIDSTLVERLDNLQNSIGNYTPENTVESSINQLSENITSVSNDLSALAEENENLKDALEVLNGNDEGSIQKAIDDTKAIIDNYTVNGFIISDNVTLTSDNIAITDSYSTVSQKTENIIPGDIITAAISKLEVMLANTTLAITAAINDIDFRLGRFREYDENGEIKTEATGICKRVEEIEDIVIEKSRD